MLAYRIALLAVWIAGCIAGYFYSQRFGLTFGTAAPIVAAFLLELSLYAGLAFSDIRQRMERMNSRLAFWLLASAVVPYLLYSLPIGVFRWYSPAAILLLAAISVFWFRLLPHKAASDVAYLCLTGAVVLSGVFDYLYLAPTPRVPLDMLGRLMWIRLGISSVLFFRRMDGIGFGFWPDWREWRIGLLHYLGFLPVGILLIYLLQFARFSVAKGWQWKAPLTFLGILWVVALSEELFFRGILQQSLVRWLGKYAGLLITSLVFGAVHLPFGEFPNWKFAALAAVTGWFYGEAYLRGNGIRAAMVTHALVVTTWRTLTIRVD